jgi:hypothetical protein
METVSNSVTRISSNRVIMNSWASYLARGVDPLPKPIVCKAAVLYAPNEPFRIEV